MSLNIYNTLTKQKKEFIPLIEDQIGLYSCGPTVYNYPHIGNYRAYIFSDMLKRYLKYKNYNVKHVMNITDVDDKTIRESQTENKKLSEFTEFYTEAFLSDCRELNILPADIYTKATDYIDEMVSLIKILLDKGYAYKMPDGSVYFDIKKDEEYGKLSGFDINTLKENAKGRIQKDEYDKDNTVDFALWKAWDDNDGDVFWDTSLGKGRPGWHIECSAMSMSTLGESFDIHTGGVDNIFPHHENEIAQSECATGKTFAKYFMHNEHLLVDGHKMSKSLNNFYTLKDLINKNFDPISFRLWLYNSHYSSKANFTFESLAGNQITLEKLRNIYLSLGKEQGKISSKYKDQFIEAMDDNLNTAKALSILWELIKDKDISSQDKLSTILDFDKVLGLNLEKTIPDIIPDDIITLANKRQISREQKDWNNSDEIRSQIHNLGYEVKDIDSGYTITKI